MSVIVEFSIPASNFILGRALKQTSGLAVELEQMIPTGDATIPYFWVIGEGRDQFDAVLEREDELASFDVVDELNGRRLYNPIEPAVVDTKGMTEAQRDLIQRAYDEGYFEVPRKITLAELADDLGISDQTVNERLRRGLNALIGSTLKFDSSRRQ